MLALVAAACSESSAATRRLTVFAAASLEPAFDALATEFEERHPAVEVALHCAGTPRLVLQLREGAAADVFASADEVSMQRIEELGLLGSTAQVFARNHLTIVTRPGNPKGIRELADLARDDLRVLLCGPEVPAGRYARSALTGAGVNTRSVSDEPNVNAVLGKLRLGEVDAGIVYATDAVHAAPDIDAVAIAPAHDVSCTYPIAVLRAGGSSEFGEAFVAFIGSADGQAILRDFGFAAP